MSSVWIDLVVVGALVVINAVLAGTEMAFVSLREGQLQAMAAAGPKGEQVARLARNPNRYLGAVQLGITLAGFLASAAAAVSISEPMAAWFGGGSLARAAAVAMVTVLLALTTLVLGELVPKRLAMQKAQPWSLAVVRPLSAFIAVTRPVILGLSALTNLLVRVAGGDPSQYRGEITAAEIVDLVEAQPNLTDTQRRIMAGAVEISSRTLREVLVPRNRVVCIDESVPVDEARVYLRDSGHSRAPVIRKDLDNPIGQVHLRDLLDEGGGAGDRATPLLSLPETVSVLEALRQFQTNRCELAAVIDEHGGTAGIITIEDLVEELVGEIYDETDRDLLTVRRDQDGAMIIPGSFPIHDLSDLALHVPQGQYSTVAGLVLDRLGHMALVGDRVVVDGIEIEVIAASRRSIEAVRIATPSA